MSHRTIFSLAASVIIGIGCIATISTDAFAYRGGRVGVGRAGVHHAGVYRGGVYRGAAVRRGAPRLSLSIIRHLFSIVQTSVAGNSIVIA